MLFNKWIIVGITLFCFALNLDGQTIDPKAKPFKINGSIGGNASYNSISGIPQRRQPYGYGLFGTVNIQLYGWSLPFSIAISQQGSSFSQPFSRFGVSPQYKWIKLYAGYRNMNFSEFTLGGVTFLGGGVELTPGKFRFAAMYGRLRKAIDQPQNQYEIPQYQRNGYGFKVGFGTKTFIDLSFFNAKDDINSLPSPDSLILRNPPEASTTLGLNGRISMGQDHWIFDYDAAIGTYTRDLRVEEIENIGGLGGSISDYLDVNASSNAAFAASTGLEYKNQIFSLGGKYRYVQSGFQTLGTNYLLNDLEMITIKGGLNLIKNRMNINGSFGIQNNNLSERKYAKTSRNIGSASINYRATDQLSFNVIYSNFSIYQTVIRDSIFADSVMVDQMNHLVNFGATYIVVSDKYTHSYMLNTSFQELADQRENQTYNAGNQLISLIFTYGIRFNEKKFGLTFGANYQDFSSLFTAQSRYGANVGFNIQLLERKLNLRLKQIWNRSVLVDRFDNIYNTQLSLVYAFVKKHSLTFSSAFISRQGVNSFTELTASIGYRARF